MAKKYDLGKKSDMKRFVRDLEKEATKSAIDDLKNQDHEIECPSCHKMTTVKLKSATYYCQHCHEEIDFELKVNL